MGKVHVYYFGRRIIFVCVCVIVSPAVLLDEIEAAESEGNDDRIEGLLCGAVKQLKMNRAKPDTTLYLSLMFLAKIKPNVFATEGIIEVRCLKKCCCNMQKYFSLGSISFYLQLHLLQSLVIFMK